MRSININITSLIAHCVGQNDNPLRMIRERCGTDLRIHRDGHELSRRDRQRFAVTRAAGAIRVSTLGLTGNSLSVAYENASAAERALGDRDFAEETARLSRSHILAGASSRTTSRANVRR